MTGELGKRDVEAEVEAKIEQLYTSQRMPAYDVLRVNLMKSLAALVPSHVDSLLAVAERKLQELHDGPRDVGRANYGLHVLFDFFEGKRLPQIRTLVERALQVAQFRMKERYIQTLEELRDPDSLPQLAAMLSLYHSGSIEDEDIRTAVLNALAGYDVPLPDASPVIRLLGDRSLRIRRAALNYLLTHPATIAVSPVAARVVAEDDPDLVADALDFLEHIDPVQAIAAAERRLASTPPPELEVVEVLRHATDRLRSVL